MADTAGPLRGGCLCGALRYAVAGEALFAGYCCCADCRRVSGSGYVPFLGVRARDFAITGETRQTVVSALRGTRSTRNFCARCGSLVFGGVIGLDEEHTLYAGSLDEPNRFRPTMAIFLRDKPDWVRFPPELRLFDTMPD